MTNTNSLLPLLHCSFQTRHLWPDEPNIQCQRKAHPTDGTSTRTVHFNWLHAGGCRSPAFTYYPSLEDARQQTAQKAPRHIILASPTNHHHQTRGKEGRLPTATHPKVRTAAIHHLSCPTQPPNHLYSSLHNITMDHQWSSWGTSCASTNFMQTQYPNLEQSIQQTFAHGVVMKPPQSLVLHRKMVAN